jgi:uncharacterized membrane protein SpoIIM required for sporulation
MFIIVIISYFIGSGQLSKFKFPLDQIGVGNMEEQLINLASHWSIGNFSPVFLIFWQNIRVLLISFVLGVISMGIFGVIPLIASIGIVGYIMALLNQFGLNTTTYLVGFILPHGLFEISAIAISTAAILHMGLLLATPDDILTIGEVWIQSIARWAKILVGIVIPLLFLAAIIEAWITPKLALWLLF